MSRPPAAHPFLDHPGPIPFAHRGGAGDAPENTMPAFEHAVALGYRYLETDVQVTADGVLVAFHDDDLVRTCGVDGRISALPWSEVSAARVDGAEPIPLLEDLLGQFPEVRLNIDCKTDAALDALVAAIRRTRSLDRVCVGSFSDRRLTRLRHALGAGLCTSMGPRAVARLRAGSWLAPPLAGSRAALAVQVPVRRGRITLVDERLVRTAHRHGLAVHVWTIDDPAEMERLLDLGVDGIMTDRPAILREVLERRHQWL
jgi:glycerophosphoryl diester phosphodiesterase